MEKALFTTHFDIRSRTLANFDRQVRTDSDANGEAEEETQTSHKKRSARNRGLITRPFMRT